MHALRDISNASESKRDRPDSLKKKGQNQAQSFIKGIISKTDVQSPSTSYAASESDVSSVMDASFGDLSTLSWGQKQFDVLFAPGPMGFHMEPIYEDDHSKLGCRIKDIDYQYYPMENEAKQSVWLFHFQAGGLKGPFLSP